MTSNRPRSSNRFPPPYRAPGILEELAAGPDERPLAGDSGQRRYQRALDGWVATRIRKQSRHWRPR
jgi:hypothetical protein